MIILLLHLVLGISLWTLFSLTSKGSRHNEIKENLYSLRNDLISFWKNLNNLIRLLIQDLLLANNDKNTLANRLDNISGISHDEKIIVREEIYASEIATISNPGQEEDLAVSGFSQEVIDLINEEESKAA